MADWHDRDADHPLDVIDLRTAQRTIKFLVPSNHMYTTIWYTSLMRTHVLQTFDRWQDEEYVFGIEMHDGSR